jgi:hypothetical protein
MIDEVRDALLPDNGARRIQRGRVDCLRVVEVDVEPLAIPGDRGGGLRIVSMPARFERSLVHDRFPNAPARVAVETQDPLLLRRRIGRREVDAIAHHGG